MPARSTVSAFALALLLPAVAGAQTQLSPDVQRMVDAQLATPKLNPSATVTVDLAATPVRDVLAAIAKAGGITVRYHSGVTNLDAPTSAKLANATIEDSLQLVLGSRGLAFKVTGSKSVFIYRDTPENREKYSETRRTFSIVNADVAIVGQTLNNVFYVVGPDDVRPAMVTDRESRTITVRATADMMTKVAKLIADADKR